ncbi:MAG: DUF4845 domain-containing protein [Cellvibrionaceae bacterium]|nr:DUF4845 domain-containing protein [Cellvibrionaceae bacterium]
MSSLAWFLALSLFGFALLCLFRIGPSYLNNRYVVSALEGLAQEPDLHELSRTEIQSKITSFAVINGLRDPEVNSFKIVKESRRTLVNSEYEKRVNFLYNIDLVMTFKNQLDSSNVEACCSYIVEDESAK